MVAERKLKRREMRGRVREEIVGDEVQEKRD